jgi:hypothetical protein
MAGKLYEDKVVIIGAIATIGVIIGAVFVTKQRKKKIYTEIEQRIKTGGNVIGSMNSPALDVTYWKTSSSTLLTVPQANAIATGLYDKYSYWGSNDDDILTLIMQIKNLAQFSQVAYYFNENYSETLQAYLNRALDRSLTKISNIWSSPNLDKVNNYISTLK